MPNEPTMDKLKALKLDAMALAWAEQQKSADIAKLAFDERLGLLVDAECVFRENRRLGPLLKEAKLKLGQACVEDIDYPPERELDKAVVRQLAACRWVESIRFLRVRLEAKNLLEIGLGIGSLPAILGRRGIDADVVEIDPAVVRFAQQYFGLSTKGQIHVEDARTFLRRTNQRYDLIVHDTCTGGTTPEHLLSLEVLMRIHELLRAGGVLALNFAGYEVGPDAKVTWAVARLAAAILTTVSSVGQA